MVESDPTQTESLMQTLPTLLTGRFFEGVVVKCFAGTHSFSVVEPDGTTFAGTYTLLCGRQQALGQSLTPVGFRLAGSTRRRLQPTFRGDFGMLFSSQQAPVPNAGNFNVMFDFGPGVEFYYSHSTSVRLEYLVQHYGNLGTAGLNPGVDNGFAKVTWTWGR
jgi:hypothetical protein